MVNLYGLPMWDIGYVEKGNQGILSAEYWKATHVEPEMTNVEIAYLKIAIIKVVFLKGSLANLSVEKFCVSHFVDYLNLY